MTSRISEADLEAVAALDDARAAVALSALPGTPALGDAHIIDIQNVLLISGEWGAIKIASRGSDATALLCLNTLALFESPDADSIGFGDSESVLPAITAMLAGLVSLGLISHATKDAILAMSLRPTKKYNPEVTSREVGIARGSKE